MAGVPIPIERALVRALLPPALTLFVVPAFAWIVATWGTAQLDGRYLEQLNDSVEREATLSDAERAELHRFYEVHPPSSMCADPTPGLADYRKAVCAPLSDLWQFQWAARTALFAIGLGVAGGLAALGLAGLASRVPSSQYASFVGGSWMLRGLTVAEIVIQGALAVWCSFWITALAFNVYVVKLILIVAVIAGAGVWAAVRGIFHSPNTTHVQDAIPVSPDEAPSLWERIRAIASQLGTAAPNHLLAGVDDNFFVTEAPISLLPPPPSAFGDGGRTGRSLYVSLPLLRILDFDEADAVIGHELAHFSAGDTAQGARMGPELQRFDAYLDGLREQITALPALYLMQLYRLLFEVALARNRRDRELRADRAAARIASPDALIRALVKITAYASYRGATQEELFSQASKHEGPLRLAERVASGWGTHLASPAFRAHLVDGRIPHPYDSHPPLAERIANVGASVNLAVAPDAAPQDDDVARILAASPAVTWADAIDTARSIEDRLWAMCEDRFTRDHEQFLAHRYAPATEEERALVLRHFPDRAFRTGKGDVVVSIDGLTPVDGPRVAWDDVLSASIEDGTFAKSLNVTVHGGSVRKVDLRALGVGADDFKLAFSRYWQRHQVMRKLQAQLGP